MIGLTKMEIIVLGVAASILLSGVLFWLVGPHFEAQAWNRLTGGNATYWDALWVELRVDCNTR